MGELKWYVVRAISGQEKKAKAYLEKEIDRAKLNEYVSQVLIPTEKVFQVRKTRDGKTKKVAVERNFFPGYIMVEANLSSGETIHTIKNTPGIIGFLEVDGRGAEEVPIPMRESEINRILGKVDESAEAGAKHEISFTIGENIKIMDGAFNGFTGTVEEIFEEKKKLNVMVKIFGRNTPVELNYMQVEKIQ